jgi:hypothetical protein
MGTIATDIHRLAMVGIGLPHPHVVVCFDPRVRPGGDCLRALGR